MATTTAWTRLYRRVLLTHLGLQVTPIDLPGADAHLKVRDGAGRTFIFSTDPHTRPHYLQIYFGVEYSRHADALTASPRLMLQLAQRLNLAADTVKVLAASPTSCDYLIETYLAAPGTLPDPALLTALTPAWLNNLINTHEDLTEQIDAAGLYATHPGD